MRVAIFSTKPYDRQFLTPALESAQHDPTWLRPQLAADSVLLARGFPAICAFVNDNIHAEIIQQLAAGGTQLVALRCAGFNNVDLQAAAEHGIRVTRVPAYSPYAVAEHTIGLMLALNRRLYRAYNRVREGNFALDGLLGFDMHGRTVGVVGTGKIGEIVVGLLRGFGCRVLAHDIRQNPACIERGAEYAPLERLWSESDIITLHCPLVPDTHHLINAAAIEQMKPGIMLINTSRGPLVDTRAVIGGLKSGKIGYLGLDVYEEEEALFFEDLSNTLIPDDTFSRLLTFPNVLITGHQAFFTTTALTAIARTTAENLTAFEQGGPLVNEVSADQF